MEVKINSGKYPTEYNELNLGEHSRRNLLRNVLQVLGFEYHGPESIEGQSGVSHPFEAIGRRDKNILLVVGGAEAQNRHQDIRKITPRQRMEAWRNSALLSSYDIQSVLAPEGLVVDLLFFHNVNTVPLLEIEGNIVSPDEWWATHGLHFDHSFSHAESPEPIQVLASTELAEVASLVGACFLTLDDLTLEEIAILAADATPVPERVNPVLRRVRVPQYFDPPTDELILVGSDLMRGVDRSLITQFHQMATSLGHRPAINELVPQADFNDPVATAIALEKHKYISFEHTVEVLPEGRKITQTIKKTAQGSFIIRVLKSIGLPELAKAVTSIFSVK